MAEHEHFFHATEIHLPANFQNGILQTDESMLHCGHGSCCQLSSIRSSMAVNLSAVTHVEINHYKI